MKVFYDKKQNARSSCQLSPSARKPRLVVRAWQKLRTPVHMMPVRPAALDELYLAHSPAYVRDILSCRADNGFGGREKDIAKSLPWTVGSLLSAAKHAYQYRETVFSPTSGFHHAKWDSAAGFCTFAGLTIAAIVLHDRLGANRIGILDLDSHSGDGTDDTLAKANANDYVEHYSLGYEQVDQYNNEQWLLQLPELIVSRFADCDIVLYQAGVDCHEKDPFVDRGHFNSEQLKRRDHIVFETLHQLNIPAVVNLAGGYQTPLQRVIDLHQQTAQAYLNVHFPASSYPR